MLRNRVMSRRTFLRGSLFGCGLSLGLPLLEAMLGRHGDALADGSPLPRRFGVFWWGSGVKRDRWLPVSTGTEWELTPELAPLANVKARLTLVSGTHCPAKGTVHHAGQAGMLCGEGATADGTDASVYKHASIDVRVARSLRREHVDFESLNLAVEPGEPTRGAPGNISFNGSSFNVNETSPAALFARLLRQNIPGGDGGGLSQGAARRAAARARVLDAVAEDAAALARRLGARDRMRLDQHLENVAALQRRLRVASTRAGTSAAPTCRAATAPAPDLDRSEQLQLRHRALVDVLSLALACDMTRVFTYQFSTWYAAPFTELGQRDGLHTLTHDEPGAQPEVDRGVTYTIQQLAYLLEALQALPEGEGSLLDQMAILCASEVSEGIDHSLIDMPIIVAGRGGGTLRAGQHLRVVGQSAYRVYVSLQQALGLPHPTFGEGDARETEGLPGLLV